MMSTFKEESCTRLLSGADNFDMRGRGFNMFVLFASVRFAKKAPMAQNPLVSSGKAASSRLWMFWWQHAGNRSGLA